MQAPVLPPFDAAGVTLPARNAGATQAESANVTVAPAVSEKGTSGRRLRMGMRLRQGARGSAAFARARHFDAVS